MTKPDIYTTVRTAVETFDDGSEAILRAISMRSGDTELLVLDNPDGDDRLILHSRAQAEALVRAINAAAKVLDWDDLPTIELAQEARDARRRVERSKKNPTETAA